MFTVEQTYDLRAMTALNVAGRKTVRRWYNILRVVVWLLLILSAGTMLVSMCFGIFDLPDDWIFPASCVLMLTFLVFEDKLNGWLSLRSLLPGSAHSVTVFTDESYTVSTDTTVTEYQYANITSLCEVGDYYVCFLGTKHGQCFDKRGFQQGDPDAFRVWLEQKTGQHFKTIKSPSHTRRTT
ncbi:MAG: YcxB family protein [Oscillospiraceae bacterium]|nr:YcxB family protein [Oscillospiraceae bacterium]